MNLCNKLLLLLWHKWMLIKRSNFSVIVSEILVSLLGVVFLLVLRGMTDVKSIKEHNYTSLTILENNTDFLCNPGPSSRAYVAYSPKSPLAERTVRNICKEAELKGFENAAELNKAIENDTFAKSLYFAVQFNGQMKNSSNFEVTLRLPSNTVNGSTELWFTSELYPPFDPELQNNEAVLETVPEYHKRGFLYLQQHVILQLLDNNETLSTNHQIEIHRYPTPDRTVDMYHSRTGSLFSVILIWLVFITPAPIWVKNVTLEKESQLKEFMKVMGLTVWLNWLSWFIRNLIISVILTGLVIILTKLKILGLPIFPYSSPFVLFLFFVLLACSISTFGFIICALCSKATNASMLAQFILVLPAIPVILLIRNNEILKIDVVIIGLLSPLAGLLGLSIIFKFEFLREGVRWNNIWRGASSTKEISFATILLILFFDTILYFIIALYLDRLFPGEYGIPQPWYYPFKHSFWRHKQTNFETSSNDSSLPNKNGNFEEFTEKRQVGIKLQNLSKTFGRHEAVKSINLEMYEGHITVLLGHNGAGKTTVMSMISALIEPTSGTAIVNGYDIRKDTEKVRKSLGLCAQSNVLFDNLTVRDHLYFFCRLKGTSLDKIDQEIDECIKRLGLEDQKNVQAKHLSGGTKRKLCVAIAFCGNSKVLMLDEPTTGMDPIAKREVWKILQEQKNDRTIFLTTHYTDEADILGDRIAIMAAGELQCCGSGFFLKRRYKTGYYLVMDVAPNCQSEKITTFLRKYVPYVQKPSFVGSELAYRLSENESSKFEHMLRDIEDNLSNLLIRSYGISLATLEEVFMKSGVDKTKIKKENNVNNITETKEQKTNEYYHGCLLRQNQWKAMFLKKFLSSIRSWLFTLLQIFIPIVIVVVTYIVKKYVMYETYPALKINLDLYKDTIILIEGKETDYYKMYQEEVKKYEMRKTDNIQREILNLAYTEPSTVKMHYIVGASFTDGLDTAWFNGYPYHAAPLALSLLLNSVYKNQTGLQHSVEFINHPIPPQNQLSAASPGEQNIELIWAILIAVSFYIIFYVQERKSYAKHLQIVSGMNIYIFWTAAFLYDLFLYLITISMVLIFFTIVDDPDLSADNLCCLVIVLLGFGFCVLPFIYLFSKIFDIPVNAFMYIFIWGYFSGPLMLAIQDIVASIMDKRHLEWIVIFSPFYLLSRGIINVFLTHAIEKECDVLGDIKTACNLNTNCCNLDRYRSSNILNTEDVIIIECGLSVFLFIIIILTEYGLFSYLMNKLIYLGKRPIKNQTIESDVQEENNKIRNTSLEDLSSSYILILRDVTKYYNICNKFLAVNGISIGVKPSECFGLLGLNGAGKTTTFKMITGDTEITYGNIWVKGLNTKSERRRVNALTGYCSQTDAVLENLTPRESLKIWSLIRGVPPNKCKEVGEQLAEEFDFSEYLDVRIKKLSGGTKRKLNTALALIGDPPIIYLDEPTAGMDPDARRTVWNRLSKLREKGKCIILTTHNMEECEVLCTRVAIMINGNFHCLGSIQSLKNKFAKTFNLTIKISKDKTKLDKRIADVDSFVQKNFPGSTLKERYQEQLSYELPKTSTPLSQMFGIVEVNKGRLYIEDYSLGQCSLEQVFLTFAKEQR